MDRATDNSYLSIMDALEEGVYFLDNQRNITYWNRAAEKITGYGSSEVIGRSCKDNILIHVNEQGVNLCQNFCPVMVTIQKGIPQSANVYLHHKDGYRVSVHVRTFPFKSDGDEVIGVAEVFSDNSFQRIESNKIKELIKYSFIDEATGCYNHRYARSKISSMLTEMNENDVPFAILLIKINNYQQVYQEYGQKLAETIMVVAAKTTKSAIDLDKIVCRWKDEQIMVLIPNAKPLLLHGYADKLAILLQETFIFNSAGKIYPQAIIAFIMAKKLDQMEEIVEKISSSIKEKTINVSSPAEPETANES